MKINDQDVIKQEVIKIESRLKERGMIPKVINHKEITDTSWVPGEGGFHNHSLIGDRSQSWSTQWQVLKRWHLRIRKLDPLNENNIPEVVDFLHAFVVVCFHLKDYVAESLNQKLNKNNCALFFFPEFLICSDIANSLKHLVLDRPSISSQAAFHREKDLLDEVPLIKTTIYVGRDSYSYTHIEFIDRCIAIWEEYLLLKGLSLAKT